MTRESLDSRDITRVSSRRGEGFISEMLTKRIVPAVSMLCLTAFEGMGKITKGEIGLAVATITLLAGSYFYFLNKKKSVMAELAEKKSEEAEIVDDGEKELWKFRAAREYIYIQL